MQVLTTALIFPTASEGDREGAARHTGCHRPAEPLGYPTVQSLPETPQSTAVHGSPRQRSSDHNHLRCTEDRRHCKARWTETKGARPPRERGASSEMRIESECGLRSSRVHESSSCAYGTPHSRQPERAAAGTLNAYSALPSQYGVTYSRSRTYLWYDS